MHRIPLLVGNEFLETKMRNCLWILVVIFNCRFPVVAAASTQHAIWISQATIYSGCSFKIHSPGGTKTVLYINLHLVSSVSGPLWVLTSGNGFPLLKKNPDWSRCVLLHSRILKKNFPKDIYQKYTILTRRQIWVIYKHVHIEVNDRGLCWLDVSTFRDEKMIP